MKIDNLHIFLIAALVVSVAVLTVELNDLLGPTPTEQQFIDVGRTMEITKLYSTPENLQDAIDEGKYEYDDLTPLLKTMMDVSKAKPSP